MNINATLFVESVIFMGFVGLTMKYVWPSILQALNEREQLIRHGINQAQKAEQTLADANKEADHIVKQAQEIAAVKVKDSEAEARDIINSARKVANAERERIVEEALARVESDAEQVRDDLVKSQLTQLQLLVRKLMHKVPEGDQLNDNFVKRFLEDEVL